MAQASVQNFTPSSTPAGKLLAGSILALLLTVAVMRIANSRGESSRLEVVERLMKSWHLVQAERELEFLYRRPGRSVDVERRYAELLLLRGKLREARDIFQKLIASDSTRTSDIMYRMGITQFFLGQLDSAEISSRNLLACNDDLSLARGSHLLGRICFNRASYDSAMQWQERGLRAAQRARSRQLEADALRQIGVLTWYRGKPDAALNSYYEPALEIYRSISDKIGEATTLSNIGLIHASRNDRQNQLKYELQAYDIRKRIGDQIGLVDSYYFLHYVGGTGKSSRTYAYKSLRRSYDLATNIGYSWGAEVALRALMQFISKSFNDPMLFSDWIDSSLTNLSGEGRILLTEARAKKFETMGDYARASALYWEAVKQAEAAQLPSERMAALVYYGNTLKRLGRYEAARKAYHEARREPANQVWKEEWVDAALADLEFRSGNFHEAKKSFKKLVARYDDLSVQELHGASPEIGFEETISTLNQARSAYYRALVRLLVQTGDKELFEYFERERLLPFWGTFGTANEDVSNQPAVQFVRMLEAFEQSGSEASLQALLEKAGELMQEAAAQRRLISEITSMMKIPQPPSVREVQDRLEEDELLLEYSIDAEQTLVYCVKRGRTQLLRIPLEEQYLQQLVQLYRSSILRGRGDHQDSVWVGISARLFDLLMRPAFDHRLVKDGDRLIIAPRGVLYLLPFHTLVIDGKGETVLERHTVSYIPSATFLVERRKSAGRKPESLLAAAPQPRTLRFSEAEVQSISANFRNTSILVGSDATAQTILEGIKSFDVIHIAAHGRLNSRFPLFSTLQCADRSIELHELLRQRMGAGLVVLSACESGLSTGIASDIPHGEDLVSFPRAFLHAGAANIIGSMWLVEDETTASLMGKFYKHLSLQLKNSALTRISESLAMAQREFITERRQNGLKSHPFYWAPFYLTGSN
ncbi:MAG TPA: CHAT domain-containing protein [Bacteroidota bacterium]|nr:CHAT domain-containing protein [Bacteroidota bacterium]